MESTIYNQKGKEAGKITVPESIFGVKWNADLVHQVITAITSNSRANTADARMRGEVAGGGKKPWRQKGTGRARHGSIRSPLWKGGGVTHGPTTDKNYFRKVNKKMKTKALYAVLSKKLKDGQIIFVDDMTFKSPKTKDAAEMVKTLSGIKGYEKLSYQKANTILVTTPKSDLNITKSFRNLSNTTIDSIMNLNPLEVVNHRYLVMVNPAKSVEFLESKSKK